MNKNELIIGVNYWASHAGTDMWKCWDEAVVDADFKRLADLGVEQVRLFPIWSQFQPITELCGWSQIPYEFRKDEEPLADSYVGYCGMDETMLCRFERALDLALKHKLKVGVGILVGWMSGRIFVPTALERRNLLTDPVAIQWELSYIQYMVRRFKEHPAIVSWSAGNETNCLATATETEKLVWAQNMYNAIRAIDPVRPITEDMHPLRGEGSTALRMRRYIHDATTVHPYAAFTPYAANERLDSMRGMLHPIAEARAYSDITGLDCQIEEIGTLGDFMCSKKIAAGIMNSVLWSALASDIKAVMWWCANEQSRLIAPPYDWKTEERELGLFDSKGNPKPVAEVFRRFIKERNALPFEEIPSAETDAVCLLQGGKNDWGVILGSFVLSKQAGLNLSYAHHEAIPDSKVYMLPCLSGDNIPLHSWKRLLDKVSNGAVLYISYNDWLISGFRSITGNELIAHSKGGAVTEADGLSYPLEDRLIIEAKESSVIIRDTEGYPLYTVHNYGKGKVYFLAAPLELNYCNSRGGFSEKYCEIYKMFSEEKINKAVKKSQAVIGITEHPVKDGKIIIAINYSSSTAQDKLAIAEKYILKKVCRGNISNDGSIVIPPYEAVVFEVKEKI